VEKKVTTSAVAGPVHIEWDKIKCSNCMLCAVVCSERHTGTSAPSRAHIRIIVDLLANRDVTSQYCRQCQDADCAAACPEDAIMFDAQIRAWVVHEESCLACGACVVACPYEAVVMDPETNVASKCDLCEGAVRCVEICATNALVLASA
jgi:Fe-S-cluster-containing hydrogenase component 2